MDHIDCQIPRKKASEIDGKYFWGICGRPALTYNVSRNRFKWVVPICEECKAEREPQGFKFEPVVETKAVAV